MPSLLIHRARCVATLDHTDPAQASELRDASIFIRDQRIANLGPETGLPDCAHQADETIDAHRHLVTPGLVNTHHHMFQSLTRAIPEVQNAELFSWLRVKP